MPGLFDVLQEIVDFIEDELLYEEMIESVGMFWDDMATAGNEGQASLAYDAVIPAGEDAMASWEDSWPDIDISDYEDACLGSHEAAESAWSETISEACSVIGEFQAEAADIQESMWYEDEEGDEEDDGAGPDDF